MALCAKCRRSRSCNFSGRRETTRKPSLLQRCGQTSKLALHTTKQTDALAHTAHGSTGACTGAERAGCQVLEPCGEHFASAFVWKQITTRATDRCGVGSTGLLQFSSTIASCCRFSRYLEFCVAYLVRSCGNIAEKRFVSPARRMSNSRAHPCPPTPLLAMFLGVLSSVSSVY